MNYIELTNNIKENYTVDWLTPSQAQLYEKLTKKFKVHKIINIYGSIGVGKTFLGWNLADYFDGNYAQKIESLESNNINILDNCSNNRNFVRSLLPIMVQKSIKKIFVITDNQVRDDYVSFELKLSNEDKKVFKHNLWEKFDLNFTKDKNDMHSLIKFNII